MKTNSEQPALPTSGKGGLTKAELVKTVLYHGILSRRMIRTADKEEINDLTYQILEEEDDS